MTTTSYWLARTPERRRRVASSGPVDVVVVGGGVTGCSCARSLADAGLRVRLVEAREIAGGASGRNGGFALRGGADGYDETSDRFGAGAARMLWQLSERSLGRLEGLAGDAFRRVGSLRLAVDDAELRMLRREHDALEADGFAVEWVASLPERLGGLYAGALRHPGDGALDPARWVRRLAALAAEAGVEIVEGQAVPVSAVDQPDAEAVVVATDGAIASLLPELASIVRPVRGQVLITEPLAERLFDQPHYARDGFDYWQQLPNGRLLVGGRRDTSIETEDTAVEATTRRVQDELESLVVELAGRLPQITHRWAGIWGETTDRLPLAGLVPGRDRVWVAGGYSGHGNVLGLACGELVAGAITGAPEPELALFDPARLLPVRAALNHPLDAAPAARHRTAVCRPWVPGAGQEQAT